MKRCRPGSRVPTGQRGQQTNRTAGLQFRWRSRFIETGAVPYWYRPGQRVGKMRNKCENPGCIVGEGLAPSRRTRARIAKKYSANSYNLRIRRTFSQDNTPCCREGASPSPTVVTGLCAYFATAPSAATFFVNPYITKNLTSLGKTPAKAGFLLAVIETRGGSCPLALPRGSIVFLLSLLWVRLQSDRGGTLLVPSRSLYGIEC